MTNHTSKQLFSEGGTITLTGAGGAVTGEFVAIQCISDTTFTTLADAGALAPSAYGGSGANLADSQTYPAGFTLFGRFTTVDVNTGTVRISLAASRV
jgi:hypothetical protein